MLSPYTAGLSSPKHKRMFECPWSTSDVTGHNGIAIWVPELGGFGIVCGCDQRHLEDCAVMKIN